MATFNRDKLNAKIAKEAEREKAQASGFGPKVLWWKPKSGENRIRLCPPWTSEGPNADMPFREVYRHWDIGEGGYEEKGRSFTCPVKTEDGPGGTCDICDEVTALRSSGSPADQEIIKKIYAKRRLYSNLIDLKDPVYTEADYLDWEDNAKEGDECHFDIGDTKIQVYSYGTTIYKQLLDYLQDGLDLGDFSDGSVELKLVREGKDLNTSYRLRTNPRGTPFEVQGSFEDLVYDLDNITPFPREGDMAACLSGETEKKPSALPEGAKSSTKTKALASSSEEASATVEEEEEEAPPCLNDCITQDDEDDQCVGSDEYSPCSFLAECKTTKLVAAAELLKKTKKPSRRKAKTPVAAPTPTADLGAEASMAEIEAEMARELAK